MATLNYYLDKRSIKQDGTAPLKLVVNTNEGNFMLLTGIYLQPEQWDYNQHVVNKHPQKKFYNSYLSHMLIRAEEAIMNEKQKRGNSLSKEQTKTFLKQLFCDVRTKKISEVEKVFSHFYKDPAKKQRTKDLYNVTWNKIKSFVGRDINNLSFEDIDLKWLKAFNTWLLPQCPATNSRSIHFRNLRAVFNEAINEEITTNYPFRRFKIEYEQTRKRALAIEQLRYLHNTPLKQWQQKYVDCFFLMFFLMGINGVDLLMAKPNQIKGDRLEYKRAKTGTLYSIKIEPEALEIINKYKGKKYLLNFCEKIKDYRIFMAKMNNCLKKIIPGCTSYYARHSFATIAADLDIPIDIIARMLGHSDPSKKITLIYIDFNQKKLDMANRKIIDYFLSETGQ